MLWKKHAFDDELRLLADADTLAFMFETRLVLRPTKFALETPALQKDYDKCWVGFEKMFKG